MQGLRRAAPSAAARAASATARNISTTAPALLHATASARGLNPNAPEVQDFGRKKLVRKRAVPGRVPAKSTGGKDAHKHAFYPSPHAPAKDPLFQEWKVPELVLPGLEEVASGKGQAGTFGLGRQEHPFNHFGLPKKQIAEFRLLSKPASVVREITAFTRDFLDNVASSPSADNPRLAITGSPGSGKSFLLLQAIDHCAANDWIVLYIPRGYNLVNSTTAHSYDVRTRTFAQPNYAYGTLKRFLSTNAPLLDRLHTTRTHASAAHRFSVPAGTTLAEFARLALKDQPTSLAPIALDVLLEELGAQDEVPVLVAVDDMQALCGDSLYKDPQFRNVAAWHLGMPRMLLEFAGEMRKLKRGAFIGALTNTDPQFPMPAELQDAFQLERKLPPSPYDRRSPEIMEYIEGMMQLRVPERLDIAEALAVYELWAGGANTGVADAPVAKKAKGGKASGDKSSGDKHASNDKHANGKANKKAAEVVELDIPRVQMRGGVALEGPTDEQFLARYTESGGNARALVWQGLLRTLQTSTAAVQATTGPVYVGAGGMTEFATAGGGPGEAFGVAVGPGAAGAAVAAKDVATAAGVGAVTGGTPPPPPMTAGPA
ncbi:mitochondrial ribosomal death-associated protein 3-domain-containing protein [Schizophyllum amplum]|uniref:Small ribosomal subunit protein mS29 n=1 Tax=Schizophyllum amplum TaxID=97359 RepID=A0A550BZX9_9AGAR|nr:mitochondrial ribosomal death-associated protein 3-domain-containing protein [Auriculariopsis ampla]